MTREELRTKYESAMEKVAKKEKTLARHEAQAQKKLDKIVKNGWNPEDPYAKYGTDEYHESYWLVCEYKGKLDDIKRTKKAIEDAKRIAGNWKEKLDKEEKKSRKYEREIPEALKDYQEYLINAWNECDERKFDFLRNAYKELGYKGFVEKYKYTKYTWMRDYNKEANNTANTRDAEALIMNLYNRVKDITGEVVDWKGLRITQGNEGAVINGLVIGKNGTAKVESILAGGYNIQRLHVRTLVKRL